MSIRTIGGNGGRPTGYLIASPGRSAPIWGSAHRLVLYAGLNLAFLMTVGVLSVVDGPLNPRILYLVLLFALCSSALIDLDGWNGRYSLLAMFLVAYFLMFGAADLASLRPNGLPTERSDALLSATEAVILVGAAMAILGYRMVVLIDAATRRAAPGRDWPMSAILLAGLTMWAVGAYATIEWWVFIIVDLSNATVKKALDSVGPWVASAYMVGLLMLPVGMLLIIYAWRSYRTAVMAALVAAIIVLQVLVGFVTEQKGPAMLGGIIAIVTIVLVENRIPKLWLAGAVVFVMVVFPVFQAYRSEIVHNRGISHAAVLADFGRIVKLAISAEDRVYTGPDRAQTFLERLSLRASVETIVEQTGSAAPYQEGHTLAPILAAFVPKFVWSDKPDVPTGQMMNKVFHLTDSDDIWISPSHLGELYWNFGWPGVLVGMMLIGAILGIVGARFNLAQGKTVTRLMVTVVTIKQLVAGFESSIAVIYVVWLRSLAGIGILHLLFARLPAAAPTCATGETSDAAPRALAGPRAKRYPNLLD